MKKLIALFMAVMLLWSCMASSVAALAAGVDASSKELHFIVRHWHTKDDDTGSSFQGGSLDSNGDRYFVVVEGYIVPIPENERTDPNRKFEFYLVHQETGEREIIHNSGYVEESAYVDELDHENGVIILSTNALTKSTEEYVEHFSSYSISAGHDAVDNPVGTDQLIIAYDPYVHLVKAHAFYVKETMEVDGTDDTTVLGNSSIFDQSKKDEMDTMLVYKDAAGQYVRHNGQIVTQADVTAARAVKKGEANYKDAQELLAKISAIEGPTKIYNTTTGLHTDKTATPVEDSSSRDKDGHLIVDANDASMIATRTFDLKLEAWNAVGYAYQVGMILDASGSMDAASDLPKLINVQEVLDKKGTGQTIESLGIRRLENNPNTDGNGWDYYFLTDDQLNQILDPTQTDNSLLSISGYSYFVHGSGGDYVPLGYWEGLGPYAFSASADDVSTGWTEKHEGLSLSNSAGFSLASTNGIILDAKPGEDSFTISFMIRKNKTTPRSDSKNIAPFLYIGPMSGNANNGGFYSLYRDLNNDSSRLRGNQQITHGSEITDLDAVFNDANDYRITLVFENVSGIDPVNGKPIGTVTAYRSNSGGTGMPNLTDGTDQYNEAHGLNTPITDFNIIINGFQSGYSGGPFYIDDVYVIGEALDSDAVGQLHQGALNDFGSDLLGQYMFEKGEDNHKDDPTGRDWLLNSATNTYAQKLTGALDFRVPPIIARTSDGRILGSINLNNSNYFENGKLKTAAWNHTAAGWYQVTFSGTYENHYAYIGTGKRLIGLNGTQGVFASDNNGKIPPASDEGYTYTGDGTDTPTKFYVDKDGNLNCFYSTSNNINVFHSYVYELSDSQYIRVESLQRALGLFITQLDEYSPSARVSAVRYSTGDASIDDQLDKLILLDWTNDPAISTGMLSLEWGDGSATGYTTSKRNGYQLEQYNYGLTGTTSTKRGLQAYLDLLVGDDQRDNPYDNVSYEDVPKYLIIFTDGNDTDYDKGDTTSIELADKLKAMGYTVFTVLLDGDSMSDDEYDQAETLLTQWAGTENCKNPEDYFYSVRKAKADLKKEGVDISGMNDVDILTQIFAENILLQIAHPLQDYAVTDYIDPRFDLVDKNGTVWHLNAGGEVVATNPDSSVPLPFNKTVVSKDSTVIFPLSEESDEVAQKPYLRYNSENSMYYLEWEDQTIPSSTVGASRLAVWDATVTIRAKEDFLGGNAVLSNGNETLMNYVRSKEDTHPSSGTSQSTPGWSGKKDEPEYLSKGFPRTAVNVTPAREELKITQTIFMGEPLYSEEIAVDLIRTANEQATGLEQYYWEYLERFFNYFNDGGHLAELETLAKRLDANGNPVITKRMLETAEKGKLSVATLTAWMVEDRKSGLTLPYIYLPNREGHDATGTETHRRDVIGQLNYIIQDTYSNVQDLTKLPPNIAVYPDGPTTHTITRLSELRVTYDSEESPIRKAWNNTNVVMDKDYIRDPIFKPVVGAEVPKGLIIDGRFESRIVSGEIALQVLVSPDAQAKLKELNQSVSYTADLYFGDERVGVFSAQIRPGDQVVKAAIQFLGSYVNGDSDKGIADMSHYGLPYGTYTVKNGKGTNVPKGFGFGDIELVANSADYATPGLFTLGVGHEEAQDYLAAISGDSFILGDKSGAEYGKRYTDYRFGLVRVTLGEALPGRLTIAKRIAGVAPAETTNQKTYTFIITGPDKVRGKECPVEGGGKVAFDSNGKATVTITGVNDVTIKNLPIGTYSVAEDKLDAEIAGYALTTTGEATVTLTGDNSGWVVVTNTYSEPLNGSLTVRKQVSGNAGDTKAAFAFTVMLSDTSLNGTYGDMVFSKGVAMFTLTHGESKAAVGLPAGIRYSVSEQSANQDGYATVATGDSGTIAANTTATAIFVNTKEVVDVPQTGDDSHVEPLIALAMAALLGMMTAYGFAPRARSRKK